MVDEGWLNTVRLARDCGDLSSLFPPGITRAVDLPFTVSQAIRMGLFYLSLEELPTKERPPRHIWQDAEKMDAWFQEVKRNREAEIKGEGTGDMPQNQLLSHIFKGRVPVG